MRGIRTPLVAALAVFGLLLAACGGADTSALQAPTATQPEAAAAPATDSAVEAVQPSEPPATEAVVEPPPAGDNPTVEAPAGPTMGFEPGSPILKATDPGGVSLSSGEPQLIEFFAFW